MGVLNFEAFERIPNNDILMRTGVQSMYSLLSQRCLRWLGHVQRMEDSRIPKDVLYGQLASGSRQVERTAFHFKDPCKHNMKACKIDTDTWEDAAGDRAHWRQKRSKGHSTQTVREGSRWWTKGPIGNSALLQQPTHPQASSTLPTAGTADRKLASTATQDAAALQKP